MYAFALGFFNEWYHFSNMPSTDGITAIAAWMLSCVFFVFCALMSYAYLLWDVFSIILSFNYNFVNDLII